MQSLIVTWIGFLKMVGTYLPKSFNDLIRQSKIPVLVGFWAEWCCACKMVTPVMKDIATLYKGKLVVIKVNVNQKPDIAAQYQISGIPTIMMFSKGKIVMRHSGALPFQAMKSEIDKHLQ